MGTAISLERNERIKLVDQPNDFNPDPDLSVFVVFTAIGRTMKALEKACEIARPLGAKIEVVAVQVVPFPLRLDQPPVPLEFVVRRFEEMTDGFPEKVKFSAYLCRDPMAAFKCVFNRNCLVVIGVRKSWFANRDERLARRLSRSGYDVTIVKTE